MNTFENTGLDKNILKAIVSVINMKVQYRIIEIPQT